MSNDKEKGEIRKVNIPRELRNFEYIKNENANDLNCLIFLPGLGNDMNKYVKLAKMMNLPDTVCYILQAPEVLPFNMGYSWFTYFDCEANIIKATENEERRIFSLKNVSCHLSNFINELIKCGWKTDEIFFIGFSQGAIVALEIAMFYKWPENSRDKKFGGIVAASSLILEEYELQSILNPNMEFNTPLLITHGTRDIKVPSYNMEKQVEYFKKNIKNASKIELKMYNKGHDFMSSKEEAKDVFTFFSKYIKLRTDIPMYHDYEL